MISNYNKEVIMSLALQGSTGNMSQIIPSSNCLAYVSAMAKLELFMDVKYPDKLPDLDCNQMIKQWVANKLHDTEMWQKVGYDKSKLEEVVDIHWSLIKTVVSKATKEKRKAVIASSMKIFHGKINVIVRLQGYHCFFLTSLSCYLLSLEAIQGEHIKYQLKQIEEFGKDSRNSQEASHNMEMIAYLCCLFFPAIYSPAEFNERINEGTPLWCWLTIDNVAFVLLVLENYYIRWEKEARDGMPLPKNVGIKYDSGRGLSSKEGQQRFHQLRWALFDFFCDKESCCLFEKQFWLTLQSDFKLACHKTDSDDPNEWGFLLKQENQQQQK